MAGGVDESFGECMMDKQEAIQSIMLPVVFSIQKLISFTRWG